MIEMNNILDLSQINQIPTDKLILKLNEDEFNKANNYNSKDLSTEDVLHIKGVIHLLGDGSWSDQPVLDYDEHNNFDVSWIRKPLDLNLEIGNTVIINPPNYIIPSIPYFKVNNDYYLVLDVSDVQFVLNG